MLVIMFPCSRQMALPGEIAVNARETEKRTRGGMVEMKVGENIWAIKHYNYDA